MNDHDISKQRELVNVTCSHPQGLELRLHQVHHHKIMADMQVPDPRKDSVILKNGGNQVDRDFIRAWLKENPQSDLVASGAITIVDPKKAADRVEPDEGDDVLGERPADSGEAET